MSVLKDANWISALIGKIYEAALDDKGWSRFFDDFAPALKSHVGLVWANDFTDRSVEVGAEAAVASHEEGAASFSASYGFTPEALASFASYYGQRNVWLQDSSLHHEGSIVTDPMLYPVSQLKRTEYWADWLRPQDIFHTAAAIVSKRDERSVNVTLARSERAGHYSAEELALFRILMPHFQAAYEMHRRLRRAKVLSEGALAMLEGLPFGIVLLDGGGRVLHASEKALGLAQRSARVSFFEGRRVDCVRPADADLLARMVAGATLTGLRRGGSEGGSAGAALRLAGPGGLRLQLVVTPLPSWSGPFGMEAAAALFISEEGASVLGSFSALLRAAYGLTPTEARLTEALVNGVTVQSYADRHAVAESTVRTQLKAVMGKVGVARQTDLVRVVLTGPALLRWPEAAEAAQVALRTGSRR